MNRTKHLLQVLILGCLCAASGLSQAGHESRLDGQYGLRVHAPNANWTFQDPDAPDVRAMLVTSPDQAKIRLRALDNLDGLDDDTYIRKFKERQRKMSFDNTYRSNLINGRRWYSLTGKSKGVLFGMNMNFDRENVLLQHYEAPSKEAFQKYADDVKVFLTRLEFNAAPVKRLDEFEVLEIEVVPADNAKIKAKGDMDKLPDQLQKEATKAALFKEVRAGRTDSAPKTALLTVRVFTFYRDPNTYVPSSLQPGLYTSDEYMIGGNIIEAELVFTDKETGKVIYTHVMRKRPISTVFGGDGVKHILKVIKAKK